jgi:hypothetical protein
MEVLDERNLVDVVGYHRNLKAGSWKRWLQRSRVAWDDDDMNAVPARRSHNQRLLEG